MVHTKDGLQVPGGCVSLSSSPPSPRPRGLSARPARPARQMTQDEVEEDDGKYQNCYF